MLFPPIGCLTCWVLTCWPRVCLSDATCTREQSRAADRDHRSVPTQIDQPTNLPGKDMGVSIWHYLHKYLHQIHQNWPFKSRNCTHFGDNHGRDTDSRQSPKVTVQSENHGNHGDREFVIYIHPYIYSYCATWNSVGQNFKCNNCLIVLFCRFILWLILAPLFCNK